MHENGGFRGAILAATAALLENHEITSRFVAQLHSIFDRFSIAKSATWTGHACGFAQLKPTKSEAHLDPKFWNLYRARS